MDHSASRAKCYAGASPLERRVRRRWWQAARMQNMPMDIPKPPPELGKPIPNRRSDHSDEPLMLCSLMLGLKPRQRDGSPMSFDFSGSRWFSANDDIWDLADGGTPQDDASR